MAQKEVFIIGAAIWLANKIGGVEIGRAGGARQEGVAS